jgi:phosphoenolpyruvate phosphomutase
VQRSVENATRARRLRALLESPELSFLMEAHSGLSSKIVEEAGFEGIWASGFSISAALGVRDNNEASWTQTLEVLEFMADAVDIPILVDGDTGYGNFNNVRRLIRKLDERGIAGVCIEDKLFPKTNSFIGENQPLADIDEFCGRIKAGKDSQHDPDFCLVARVEALISGRDMHEALRRAEAYHAAGADAILIHSKKRRADEILSFCREWANRSPVVIVPTMYYSTPIDEYQDLVSTIIWANHNLRASLSAMRTVSKRIFEERSLLGIEGSVASVQDVFELTGNQELAEAELRYLPPSERVSAILLAASRGVELGSLTDEIPKCMLDIRGKPLLQLLTETLREAGIDDVTVVAGYQESRVMVPAIRKVINSKFYDAGEVYSLHCAIDHLTGPVVLGYGDILVRKHIVEQLIDAPGDVVLAVDGHQREGRGQRADLVNCSHPFREDILAGSPCTLLRFVGSDQDADGEWIGLLKLTHSGAKMLRSELEKMAEQDNARLARLPTLLMRLVEKNTAVHVAYVSGHWLDVDDVFDLAQARNLQ